MILPAARVHQDAAEEQTRSLSHHSLLAVASGR